MSISSPLSTSPDPLRVRNHLERFRAASKITLAMAWPLVGARVSGALCMFAAMLMLARLGPSEVAACALVNSVLWFTVVSIWGLIFATGVLVGYHYGAKQHTEIGSVVRQSLLMGIIVGLPFTLLLWYIGPILILFKQEPKLVKLAEEYLRGYAWGVTPVLWYITWTQFFTGISKQKLATVYNLLSSAVFLLIGYVLVFGKLGLPKMGMFGMGIAYSITFMLWAVIFPIHCLMFKKYHCYKLFYFKGKFQFHYLRQLFNIGWPIYAMSIAELGALSISTLMIGVLGEISLAAQQATLQINLIAFMVPFGIAQASMIVVSQELGKRNYAVIRDLGYAAMYLSLVATLLGALAYIIAPKFLISFYLGSKSASNQATLALSTSLLILTGIMNIPDGIRTVAVSALRGLRDTIVPMLVSVVLACALSLPIGYLLAFPMHMGVIGVRLGFVLTFLLSAVFLIFRWHKLSCPLMINKIKDLHG
ncbi:MAG: MATE family efflux transporter [Gammaproteobacteria bacterium]|jgi:MATE family multidrug resistance protein